MNLIILFKIFTCSIAMSLPFNNNFNTLIYEFIKNYKHLNYGVLFLCSTEIQNIPKTLSSSNTYLLHNLTKYIWSGNIMLKIYNIDYKIELNLNASKSDSYYQFSSTMIESILTNNFDFHHAVVLDLSCDNSNMILHEVRCYSFHCFNWNQMSEGVGAICTLIIKCILFHFRHSKRSIWNLNMAIKSIYIYVQFFIFQKLKVLVSAGKFNSNH